MVKQGTVMSFVRAAFWIFLILLLMPTNDKEKADFYSAASRTVSDVGGFCTRNPQVCDNTSAILERMLRKMRTTMEMLEDMVQSDAARRDGNPPVRDRQGEQRQQHGGRGDLLVAPTSATRSQQTLRPTDLQPAWRGPGRV